MKKMKLLLSAIIDRYLEKERQENPKKRRWELQEMQLKEIIDTLSEHFNADDIAQIAFDQLSGDDKELFIKSNRIVDDNVFIIKARSLAEVGRIEQFVEELYPIHSDQQTYLFN